MKNLEKLANYKLENEKLNNVLGGKAAPAEEIIYTSGGQRCEYEGTGQYCYVYTYTSDVKAYGLIVYINDHITDTPC